MRTIIAGSRSLNEYELVLAAVKESGFAITTILSGDANGIDKLGARYAREHKIPLEHWPANWKLYGKRAGFERNLAMAESADALIAIWDNASKGTANMIHIANEMKLNVYVLYYPF